MSLDALILGFILLISLGIIVWLIIDRFKQIKEEDKENYEDRKN